MNAPLRRGACPGLSAPMQTGDGLLVRMLPLGTMLLEAFAALCAAARQHGNGVVEITARGSIQARGLNETSAPHFAAAIAALHVAASDGIAVHAGPLAGLDPDEILNAENLAVDVRSALAEYPPVMRLAPKISIVVDGGGTLNLDGLSADVRLRAELQDGRPILPVSLGGNRASGEHIGFIGAEDASAAVIRLLDVIARHGRDARARDVLATRGSGPFLAALADLLRGGAAEDSDLRGNERQSVIGVHRLRGGAFACGVGLAFGHTDATSLQKLMEAAAAKGATGVRTAPDRALIFLGFSLEALTAFTVDAEELGFVVRANDPRRFVVACAGAPICASAHIAARALAPRIAAECADFLCDQFIIHVSGCTKGCAHAVPTALTVVGTAKGCALVADGTVHDVSFAIVEENELPAALVRNACALNGEARHV